MTAGKIAFSQFTFLQKAATRFSKKILVEVLRLCDENVRLPPVYLRKASEDIFPEPTARSAVRGC